ISFIYGDKGYANAEVVPNTVVNREELNVDISVDIKQNDPVYIERVDISGNTRTRDKVIRREIEVNEGDLYSSSGIERSKVNLQRVGYFEEADIIESQGTTREKMKLDVDVVERPTGTFSVGLGFSSVDSIIGTVAISQKNLLGTGLKLDLSGTLSKSSSKYNIGFTNPWLFDKPLSAGFDLYNSERTYPDFDLQKFGGSLRFGFPIYKRSTKGYVTYRYEEVSIANVSPFATFVILDQEGDTKVSSISGYITYNSLNKAYFPTKGVNAVGSVTVAGGELGGTTNFAKFDANVTKYVPLFWGTVLAVRGTAGHVFAFAGKDLPIYEKYFLGGISTLRGFETRKVGPTATRLVTPSDPADPTRLIEEYIGGDTMLLMNTEIVFPLFGQKNFRGILFYDTGNSWDGHIDLAEVRHGAGFGVRWVSPFGPIRLELGFNLDQHDAEESSQFEFGMGTSF
ncbi:MAG: outer membrane protein assembly factor BamA, partial [Thermodesulfobacteriota bacterium]